MSNLFWYLRHSGTTSHCAFWYQIYFGTQGSFDPVLSAPHPFWYQVMCYSGTVCSASIPVPRFVTVCIPVPKPLFPECTSWTSLMMKILRRQLDRSFQISFADYEGLHHSCTSCHEDGVDS
jgi:hypothetical protein